MKIINISTQNTNRKAINEMNDCCSINIPNRSTINHFRYTFTSISYNIV